MNGIEKITQLIESDAQAEIDEILHAAKEEAAKITASYQKQADAMTESLTAGNEKAAAEREERLVSTAQMEARKIQLSAKQEVVEETYRRALKKLCAMPDEQYIDVIAALLVKASSKGNEEVIFSPEDRKRGKTAISKANKSSGGHLTLSEDSQPICGGFILKDQAIEINCTFDTLIELQRTESLGAVAKKLFPES